MKTAKLFFLLLGISISTAKAVDISVKLLDARTGLAITNKKVSFFNDSGIRCDRDPCPTNSQSYTAKSDANGVVQLKAITIMSSLSFFPEGYELLSYYEGMKEGVFEPIKTNGKLEVKLTILDSKTKQPIASNVVTFTNQKGKTFSATSSPFGAVYMPEMMYFFAFSAGKISINSYETRDYQFSGRTPENRTKTIQVKKLK